MNWKTLAIHIAIMAAAGIAAIAVTSLACRGDEPIVRPIPDTISTKIVLPMTPVLVEPDAPPAPEPTVEPRIIGTIKPDEWYVVESAIELITLQSPDGLLAIESTSGPIKVRGKFSDGTGKTETREYRSPYVYFVTAEKTGTTELILVPVGVLEAKDIVRQVLVVSGTGPIPPPVPDPDDPVVPDPPGPVTDGNRVLIVYESSDLSNLPAAQSVLMTATNVREYLNRKCSKGPDGKTPEFRIWDKDVDTTNVSQTWKDALAMPRSGIPWLMVSNGRTGFSGPLPENEAALMAKLKQYLGD